MSELDKFYGRCGLADIYVVCDNLTNTFLVNEPFNTELRVSFLELGRIKLPNYSKEDWGNIIKKLDDDWLFDPYLKSSNKSIFNLLIHFSKQVLILKNERPVVNDKHLLRWRNLSYQVGEDLMTTSYLAYMDVKNSWERNFFAWSPIIGSDNVDLHNILKKGIAENHFHLKGSAPVFALSWIALMNHPDKFAMSFDKLKGTPLQTFKQVVSFDSRFLPIDTLVHIAAQIRVMLFNHIYRNESFKEIQILQLIKDQDYRIQFNKIIHEIGSIRKMNGFDFGNTNHSKIVDYAILNNIDQSNLESNTFLVGERQLIYKCFIKVYSNCKQFQGLGKNILYFYLLIKEKLREELIQVNDKVGFANFLDYQDRKELFIKEDSIYETAMFKMAVNDTVSNNQNLESFETRVAPKNNVSNQIRAIAKYDRYIKYYLLDGKNYTNLIGPKTTNVQGLKNFYVLHFIKKKDVDNYTNNDFDLLSSSVKPRNNLLRKEVEKQAKVLIQLKESTSKTSDRIFGVDAASSEFFARPEVFGQVFRYLKAHKLSGELSMLSEKLKDNPFRVTFHVGEDFPDIVDGLRAIDEAIKFLNLRKGDRLGHVLALGIDAQQFYKGKNNKLMLSKQSLLDNAAWLLFTVKKFGISDFQDEVTKLENTFKELFDYIYIQNMDARHGWRYSVNSYIYAWKLRGDDPMLYFDWEKDITKTPCITSFDRCRINYSYPKSGNLRKNNEIKFLYHNYHFNAHVKNAGQEIRQFKITKPYINLVKVVQNEMMKILADKEIAIECNPSSNLLISSFQRYADHPISKFFNSGLTNDTGKLEKCPQLKVSINTDDQGVFGTYLENEYALLYKGLEKEEDEKGNKIYKPAQIYDWLDKIREMGLEMSFDK